MASELKKILDAQASQIESLTGSEKALAILAFSSFLTGRALVILTELQSRADLDDQEMIEMAKRHDAEAKAAWEKLKADTEPAG